MRSGEMIDLGNLFIAKSINYNYFLHPDRTLNLIYALCLFFIGYFIAKRLSILTEQALSKRCTRHQTMLVRRSVFYIIFTIFSVTSLQHLGFKLSVLLG